MLDLDDTSCVTHAVHFTGTLPLSKRDSSHKSNQTFQVSSQVLQSIMAGFSVPDEEMFKNIISENVELFLKSLKDPTLPLLETKVYFIFYQLYVIVIYVLGIDVNYIWSNSFICRITNF